MIELYLHALQKYWCQEEFAKLVTQPVQHLLWRWGPHSCVFCVVQHHRENN